MLRRSSLTVRYFFPHSHLSLFPVLDLGINGYAVSHRIFLSSFSEEMHAKNCNDPRYLRISFTVVISFTKSWKQHVPTHCNYFLNCSWRVYEKSLLFLRADFCKTHTCPLFLLTKGTKGEMTWLVGGESGMYVVCVRERPVFVGCEELAVWIVLQKPSHKRRNANSERIKFWKSTTMKRAIFALRIHCQTIVSLKGQSPCNAKGNACMFAWVTKMHLCVCIKCMLFSKFVSHIPSSCCYGFIRERSWLALRAARSWRSIHPLQTWRWVSGAGYSSRCRLWISLPGYLRLKECRHTCIPWCTHVHVNSGCFGMKSHACLSFVSCFSTRLWSQEGSNSKWS